MKAVVLILCASALALAALVAVAHRQAASTAPASYLFGAARQTARGGWRDMAGSGLILPPHFTPAVNDTPAAPAPGAGHAEAGSRWVLPLVDRTLTQAEKAVALAPELRDAVGRMAPLFDPTRLDGPNIVVTLRVSAGSAFPADVFAERWRLTSDDPNVDVVTTPLALAWRGPAGTCEGYAKRRSRPLNGVASMPLSPGECLHLRRRRAPGTDDAAPLPVVAAPLDVPAFAAPFPGGRMSSEAFWLAQRQRIEAIEAQLRAERAANAAKP